MHYVFDDFSESEDGRKRIIPVWAEDAEFMRRAVLPVFNPLSDTEYMEKFRNTLSTVIRRSYILDGDTVYWCLEMDPGLVVVRFRPDGSMAIACLADDDVDDKEGADAESMYNLANHGWDYTMEPDLRDPDECRDLDAAEAARYAAALRHVDSLIMDGED